MLDSSPRGARAGLRKGMSFRVGKGALYLQSQDSGLFFFSFLVGRRAVTQEGTLGCEWGWLGAVGSDTAPLGSPLEGGGEW